MKKDLCAVVFGGLGFVGCFFSESLSKNCRYKKIYLIDHETNVHDSYRKKVISNIKNIEFIKWDVRKPIDLFIEEEIDLICNFAAVHREPGHEHHEYYETNLLGARNICDWADRVGCKNIIFTSSISPYEPNNKIKNENSIPAPYTPYGGSKLASEKIHEVWHAKNINEKKLLIVRPGVIFGPSEGGNVSRLIRAIKGKYFVYMSNKDVIKAGIYVKELCNAMLWALKNNDLSNKNVILFNATMSPAPKLKEYVELIKKINNIKLPILNIPSFLVYIPFIPINFLLNIFGIKHPFDPVRIKKVSLSNNIEPKFLIDNNYKFKYTLKEALLDWKNEYPEEW